MLVFDEIDATSEGDVAEFRHSHENTYGQMVALGISTFAFMLFVVSVMPLMKMSAANNALWMVVGLVVLVGIGLATQSTVYSTLMRLDPKGITIEQGTAVDRESIIIGWADLAGVELEPVDPKDGRKGMKLRLLPREGEPADTFANVSLGDLTELRRTIAESLRDWRQRAAQGAGDAT